MTRTRLVASVALILGVVGLTSPPTAAGEPRPKYLGTLIDDRWNVWAGGFGAHATTEAAFSPGGPLGVVIRLEDDLGLQSRVNTAVVGGSYRFGPRHRLGFELTDINRSADRSINRDIVLPDVTFRLGAELESEVDTTMFRLKWMYNVATGDRLLAGFVAGLSTFDLSFSLKGEGEIDDGQGGTLVRVAEEGESFLAPVPLIGMFIYYAITPRLIFRGSYETISLSINGDAGRVLQTAFGAEYYVTRLIGIGVRGEDTDIEYTKDQADYIHAQYRIDGFTGYLSFVF